MKVFIKKKIDKNDFLNALKIFEKDTLNKRFKLALWNNSKSNQFIIYLKSKNALIGMIRVIKKKIFLSKKFYNVACLTSIGIFPKFRGKGYSKFLLKKSNIILKKKFKISFLIARKKLDHFYNKFDFVGNSEFYSLRINLSNKKIKTNTSSKKLFVLTNIIKKNYIKTNNKKNGYFQRSNQDWQLIEKKINEENFLIKVFKLNKRYIGYIIYKDNTIFEYGYEAKYLKDFSITLQKSFKKFIEIKNPCAKIINQLRNEVEINLTKRFCAYGGHMINYYKNKQLNKVYYNISYFDEF